MPPKKKNVGRPVRATEVVKDFFQQKAEDDLRYINYLDEAMPDEFQKLMRPVIQKRRAKLMSLINQIKK